MKKFLITLFILIIIGGAAFFIGWPQFSVPPGDYGVLRSKTHGIDPLPLRSGEFRWVWYKLIPTNVTIDAFSLAPVQREISAQGVLPSGNVYALFAGNQVDFDWEFSASFSFSLKSDMLVSLADEHNIHTQKELDVFQENLADGIEAFIIRYLSSPANADELESILAGATQSLTEQALEQFPAIENFSCVVKNARFPDFILYREMRGLYEDFIAAQRELAVSSMNRNAEGRINSLLRLNELERYGELLTKYPILLQYLTLPRGAAE